jgi:hypothetical protein
MTEKYGKMCGTSVVDRRCASQKPVVIVAGERGDIIWSCVESCAASVHFDADATFIGGIHFPVGIPGRGLSSSNVGWGFVAHGSVCFVFLSEVRGEKE